jgi:chromate transporter
MATRMCAERRRAAIALISTALLGTLTTAYAQMIAIGLGAALELAMCRATPTTDTGRLSHHPYKFPASRAVGVSALILFFSVLLGLPALELAQRHPITMTARSMSWKNCVKVFVHHAAIAWPVCVGTGKHL